MAGGTRLRSGERREQILQVALRLFAERGVFDVSTRDIAQATGISQPSLYAHFKSRDAIVIELTTRAFCRLRERMILAQSSHRAPAQQLRAMGLEYVRFGLEDSGAYRMAFMIERPNLAPTDHAAIHATGMHGFSVVHDFFRSARQSDDERTAALAQSAWATMHGLVALLLARPAFPWVDPDRLIDLHLDQLCCHAFA